LAEHLSIFLKHIKSAKELTEFTAPVIASSILLDNYPPDTYSKPQSPLQIFIDSNFRSSV
jgi:hypothetical protein